MSFTFERRLDARLLMAVIATGLLSFTGVAAETAMNVIFPTLMHEFNITTSTVQWVTTINLLMLAIIIPTSSWLKKCFPMKRLFALALFFFIGGTLLGLWSPSFFVLILGRMCQGIGTGIAMPLMFNIIIEQVPHKNTGMIMGLATLTIALGPAVGPSLGGFIVAIAGWRMIFACFLPVLLISAIGGLTCIRQSSPIEKASFDFLGFLLLAISFSCLLYALSNISLLGVTSLRLWLCFFAAAILFAFFIWHCKNSSHALLKLTVLHSSTFVFGLIALLLVQCFTLSRGFMIPNYFQLSQNVSTTLAGCIVLPACIIGAVFNPLSGRLYDHLGAKPPILFGTGCILLGLILEMLFMRHVSAYAMMAICIIYCLGQSFSIGNITTFALRSLPDARYADGTAIINTLQQLFGAIGTAVASTVVSFGQATTPNDLASGTAVGTQWALSMNVCLAVVVALCIVLMLKNTKKSS